MGMGYLVASVITFIVGLSGFVYAITHLEYYTLNASE